jgi:hypothetical protein
MRAAAVAARLESHRLGTHNLLARRWRRRARFVYISRSPLWDPTQAPSVSDAGVRPLDETIAGKAIRRHGPTVLSSIRPKKACGRRRSRGWAR